MEDGEKGNNNNNKAFKSQTSWGRLELNPSRSNQDGEKGKGKKKK